MKVVKQQLMKGQPQAPHIWLIEFPKESCYNNFYEKNRKNNNSEYYHSAGSAVCGTSVDAARTPSSHGENVYQCPEFQRHDCKGIR